MARSANPERGEHEIVLTGKAYRLRPSHEAILEIERETGKAVLTLVRLGNVGELSYVDLGKIGASLIRAGADEKDDMTRAVDADRIGELIFEEGVARAHSVFTICLLDAARGGRTTSGERKAAPAKK